MSVAYSPVVNRCCCRQGIEGVWVYGVFGVGDVSQIWGVVGGNRQSILVFS